MNKILLGLFVALVPFWAMAAPENDKVSVVVKDSVIGYTIANKQVVASVCEFPGNIFQFMLDSGQNHAIIVLRKIKKDQYSNKGQLILFDITSHKIAWDLKISTFALGRTKNLIIYKSLERTYYFNITDGKKVNYSLQQFFFIDYKREIGIDATYGVDLYTNKFVWKRKFKGNDMLGAYRYINDSTVILSSGGLHLVNLNTGTGWDYDLITRKEDVVKELGVGLATGLLTGMAVVPNTQRVGVVSNILLDSNYRLYVADKSSVSCLDTAGKTQWETLIPPKLTSKSTLFVKGENIYMLNNGYAFATNGLAITGTPFLAAFDRKTGKQLYMDTFVRGKIVRDAFEENGVCLIHMADSVCKVQLSSGAYQKYVFPLKDEKRTFTFIKGDSVLTETEAGDFVTLNELYPEAYFMQSNSDEMIVFSPAFEIKQVLMPRKYWLRVAGYKGKEVLMNHEGYVAFTDKKKKLAILQPATGNYIVADTLYRTTSTALQILPLKNIIE